MIDGVGGSGELALLRWAQAGLMSQERLDSERRTSVAMVGDAAREWHAHTERNWTVLMQMDREMRDGRGIPLECHLQKLRYVDKRALFDHDRRFLLGTEARVLVNRLEPIIRNVNLEVDELVRAGRADDTALVLDLIGLLRRKSQYLFVQFLPTLVAEKDRADWISNEAIVAARAEELRERADRDDILYRTPPPPVD